jgi:hypothetical protein
MEKNISFVEHFSFGRTFKKNVGVTFVFVAREVAAPLQDVPGHLAAVGRGWPGQRRHQQTNLQGQHGGGGR